MNAGGHTRGVIVNGNVNTRRKITNTTSKVTTRRERDISRRQLRGNRNTVSLPSPDDDNDSDNVPLATSNQHGSQTRRYGMRVLNKCCI